MGHPPLHDTGDATLIGALHQLFMHSRQLKSVDLWFWKSQFSKGDYGPGPGTVLGFWKFHLLRVARGCHRMSHLCMCVCV
jgi:hypothetical protein